MRDQHQGIQPDMTVLVRQAVEIANRMKAASSLPRKGLSDAERELVDYLEPLLPPLVARASVGEYVSGMEGRTLANRDALGTGVDTTFVIGREVYYRREDFLRYLLKRGVKKNYKDPFAALLKTRRGSQRPDA